MKSFSLNKRTATPKVTLVRPATRPQSKARASTSKGLDLLPKELNGDRMVFTETTLRDYISAMEVGDIDRELPALLTELGVNYDPDRLSDALKDRQLEVTQKALTVAMVFGDVITKILADLATGQVENNMRRRAEDLRDAFRKLGPAFVKLGQALSSRPDLLPKTYLEVLSELQDRLPCFPTAIARKLIKEELGAEVEEIFSEFSPEPVAAASLGQVYRARLRGTGEEVAVKVQRPGIADSIAIDMLLLRRLMTLVDTTITPQLRISQPLVPLVDEFAKRVFGELDYVQEGKNCERFQELYGSVPRVRTPAIFWPQSGRRVLTMGWIEGVKLTNKEGMQQWGLNIIDFVNIGIECTLRQLLEEGLFHADPHPGNLLATREGDLVYLDFGMMSEAPPRARLAIIAHVVHLVNRDYKAMCQDYYALDFISRDVDTSPIAPSLAAFFDDVLENSVSQLNFKSIVDGLGEVLFQYPFRVPAYYALILRTLTVLEGLALQADPNYRLLGQAYPYMAQRLLTDPAPELRANLEDLILEDGRLRWGRIENLVREGSKSIAYDRSKLWLLLEWLFSASGVGVRRSVARETVNVLDAAIAGAWRQNAAGVYGLDTALQLLPEGPGESESRARFDWILRNLFQQSDPASMPALTGSGPLGALTPLEAQSLLRDLQLALTDAQPRLQKLFAQPGAVDFTNEVSQGLLAKATARSVKMWMGGGLAALFTSGRWTAGLASPAVLTGASGGAAWVGGREGAAAAGAGAAAESPSVLSFGEALREAARNFAMEMAADDASPAAGSGKGKGDLGEELSSRGIAGPADEKVQAQGTDRDDASSADLRPLKVTGKMAPTESAILV